MVRCLWLPGAERDAPLLSAILAARVPLLGNAAWIVLVVVAAGAIIGASLGDLSAFLLARRLQPLLSRHARLLERAQRLVARRGMLAVFLSRWLVTPLGPATNYVAGWGSPRAI